MIKIHIIILFLLLSLPAAAQEILYNRSDSLAIEKILKKHSSVTYPSKGELVIAIAQEFIGKKYVSNTLDNGVNEPLFVSCDKLDCSTFVELATAISISINKQEPTFAATCNNLQEIRYRNGKRNGYASRLHYTSWWVADNSSRGIIEEVTTQSPHKQHNFSLNYMSHHPDNYAILKSDTAMQAKIAEQEKPFLNITLPYIPKQQLNSNCNILKIENGDIIALVTTTKGLDVSHLGFAIWREGKLHLLHASSNKGCVIVDPTTLYHYQRDKKKQIGIRVIRLI